MDNAKIGRLIYALRKEKGMTQSELAAEVGVERSSIGKYETAAAVGRMYEHK